MSKSFVLKIGGSLIYDSEMRLNSSFFNKFVPWINEARSRYDHLVLIVGGGTMSRHLVEQVKPYAHNEKDLHRIGMEVTVTNAVILSSVIKEADVIVPKTLGEALEAVVGDKRQIIVTGGFKPGWSTDMDAAVMADIVDVDKVYKLSNIDSIYTKDPRNNPNARSIRDMSWREYFTQFGITMEGVPSDKPGLHVPIGTYASQFSARKGISFFVSGGDNIAKMNTLNEVFESGTFVHP